MGMHSAVLLILHLWEPQFPLLAGVSVAFRSRLADSGVCFDSLQHVGTQESSDGTKKVPHICPKRSFPDTHCRAGLDSASVLLRHAPFFPSDL